MQFDDELLNRLRQAQRVVFFTGAGTSTESGVPTFRDEQNSLWVNFDASRFATKSGFRANPSQVWQWYAERRRQLQTLSPNPAHRVIAAWQDKAAGVTVITQNVDGFHQQAGSRNVIELHGNIAANKCLDYGHPAPMDMSPSDQPPHCQHCGSLLRPDIVWFGEELPAVAYNLAEELSFDCEVFVCIGCSMEVYPAASLPFNAARCGAYLIQINPQATPLDEIANCNLHGKVGEILPQLWQAVWQEPLP